MARAAGTGFIKKFIPKVFISKDDEQGSIIDPATDGTLKDGSQKTGLVEGDAKIGGVELLDPDDATRKAEFDTVFPIPVVQQIGHNMVHKGLSWERHIDTNNAVQAGLNVAFKTAAGAKLIHMLFGFSSSDEITFEVLRGATWTQGSGSAVLPVSNNNHAIGGNSELILENQSQPAFTANNQLIKDVTIIDPGTIFEKQFTYNAGLGAAVVVESRAAGHEWVLAPDKTYVVRMTQTDGDCKMSIDLHWYEKTPT